jgi:hypothetical protein
MENKINHWVHGAIGALMDSGDEPIDTVLTAVRDGIKRVSI